MVDKPILFSGAMVRALLDGRKTQTRRVLNPQPETWAEAVELAPYDSGHGTYGKAGSLIQRTLDDHRQHGCGKVKYAVGDWLWVREAHYRTDDGESEYVICAEDEGAVSVHFDHMQEVMASHPNIDWSRHLRRHPSIHMPRWASRLTLIVTDVRVQRVQDISEGDAIGEGCRPFFDYDNPRTMRGPNGAEHRMAPLRGPIDDFRTIWDDLNAKRGVGWDANPWVAAITFTVHRQNIDQMGDAV